MVLNDIFHANKNKLNLKAILFCHNSTPKIRNVECIGIIKNQIFI